MRLDKLAALYPHFPPSVQNVGLSVYGWFYRTERLGGDFERHVGEFRQRESWTAPHFQSYIEERLSHVLCAAFDETPYYSRAWAEAGFGRKDLRKLGSSRLAELPTTPKQALRADAKAFVSLQYEPNALLRYCSSGSTGTPITCYYTADAHRRFIAAREARSFGWAGASIRMPRSTIGGRIVVPKAASSPPYYRFNWAERQVYCSAYHIRPDAAMNYLDAFQRHRPRLFTGYASSHFLLAQILNEVGARLSYSPCALVLSSEKLTSSMKGIISKVFRARAYEEYGAVENCALATECEHGSLHVNPDFGILEIVDDHGRPVGRGQTGRVLCTGLLNPAQPLVRYEIGDLARWATDPCPCGRSNFPVIEEIVGRIEDVVVTKDGARMVRFHGIFIDLPGVLEGQVVQEKVDSFLVRVLAGRDYGHKTEELIRDRMERQLGPVNLRIERVAALERTPSGKLRAVISYVSGS